MRTDRIFIYVALVVALTSSCAKEFDMSIGLAAPGIIATIDRNPYDGTRAVFDTLSRAVSWELGDKIVVDGATYRRVAETNVFDYYSGGVTTGNEDKEAYYPVSLYTGGTSPASSQYSLPYSYAWDKNSAKVDFVPMAGKVISNAVVFHPLTSVFRVRIKNMYGATIHLCGLSISADKPLCGNFTPVFDENTGSVTGIVFGQNGSKSMSISVKGLESVTSADEGLEKAIEISDGEEYSLYVPVPAAEYEAVNLKVTAIIQKDGQNVLMYSNSSKTVAGGDKITCHIGKFYDISFNASHFEEGVPGSGTVDDPFIVNGLEGLNYIKGLVTSDNRAVKEYFCSANYKLESDLTLTEPWTETMAETISGGVMFSGVFDGNGHTIDASSEINTRPIFWDINGGVIKNVILKGTFSHNNSGCPLFCPFFYSSVGRTIMVCVVFKGRETWDGGGQGLSLFGAVKGDPHLVGAYAEAKVRGFESMGDNLDTKSAEARNDPSYQYQYMFSDTFVVGEGFAPYFVNGAVAKLADFNADGFAGAKIVHATTNQADLSTTTEIYQPTDAMIVDELNGGIDTWNATLRRDARVSELDFSRFSTTFKYVIDDAEGITIAPNSQ